MLWASCRSRTLGQPLPDFGGARRNATAAHVGCMFLKRAQTCLEAFPSGLRAVRGRFKCLHS
eukprot:11374214-Alexandrium_andersonii.AAC.1